MSEKISEKKEVKMKPGVGVDVGTAFICTTRCTEDGVFVNRFHRNSLYELDISDESADLLERSNYFFIKTSEKYYIIGEDSLNIANAIGKGNVIRPMKNGLLSPELKESSDLLFHIIRAVVGNPIIPNESLRFTVPAPPVDRDLDNLFHQTVLNNFFTKLGYSAKPINEALCVIFDCNPIMKSQDGEVPLTGVGLSLGAGMVNVCVSYKGLSLVEFSCTKCGDNIDEQVEKVTGISRSKIVKIKEKKLDLNNVDANDRVQNALSIYYDETISRIIYHIVNKLKTIESEIDGEIEIVLSGGSSIVPGFDKRFEDIIKKAKMPFKIYRVRKSPTPFFSVVQGACVRGISDHKRLIDNKLLSI